MSADLLAEFGLGSPSTPAPNSSQQSQQPSQTGSSLLDFEPIGEVFVHSSTYISRHNSAATGGRTSVHNSAGTGHHAATNVAKNIWHEDAHGADVLFDATTEGISNDDDDDWGEFESAETIPEPKQSAGSVGEMGDPNAHVRRSPDIPRKSGTSSGALNLMGLLSIEDNHRTSADKEPATSAAPSRNITLNGPTPSPRKNPKAPREVPVQPQQEVSDEWGAFVDASWEPSSSALQVNTVAAGEPAKENKAAAQKVTHPEPKRVGPPSISQTKSPAFGAQIRPTNIPPPSIILQLFPRLFEQLHKEASKVKRDSNPSSSTILAERLTCTLKVAARVVAGRTLRWKRDTFLSQSMRIGPARSGKLGGMKLNSVSKNENVKEEQEAMEVLESWRPRAAIFNSVILSSGRRPVPVISELTRVDTATPDKGAIRAPHACAICGLKRDERIPKVDENVEDSFGEWWVDHFGHTDCRRFWEDNSKLLHSR
ncbi:hypothetical protein VTN02DRAFT_3528 [Thermoascus thermophilus]